MGIADGLFDQVITSIYSVSTNGYGDETLTLVFSSVPCRWQEISTQVTTGLRETKESKVSVWVPSEYSTILPDYRVVVGTETYIVVSVDNKYNISGTIDHVRLYLV